jgi:L-rhamnose mutarotase
MERVAFKMYLKPGCKAIYKQRHNEIWPELKSLLKNKGISEYHIFFDEDTNILFAIQEQEKGQSSQNLHDYEVVQLWWQYMKDVMETNADNSPVMAPLEQVFYLK